MPGFVTCPNCSEELDIPAELRGSPVRCAACGGAFTPPAAGVPVVRRAERQEPRDDPRDDGRAEERPRHRAPAGRPRRRSNAWVWLLALGVFGVCCAGCGGFAVLAVNLGNPELVDYAAPDGRFEAAFPGPVAVATRPQPKRGLLGPATEYEHRRTIAGQTIDTYFVRSVELRERPTPDAAEAAVARVADELAAEGKQASRRPALLDGAEALELVVTYPDRVQKEALVARVAVIGDRLYVVGVRGQALNKPKEQVRVGEFWDRFRAKGEGAKGE